MSKWLCRIFVHWALPVKELWMRGRSFQYRCPFCHAILKQWSEP